MLNLKIIIGSTRPGRAADHVMPWITGLAKQHPAFTVDVLDLRDWPLPFFAETIQPAALPASLDIAATSCHSENGGHVSQ
jgi:NAD(P)H-dependent FMN reductase